ncbi:MAG TPA: enoyl-CoA hydratase-related protein [Chitinophagales bacterium]|nr:enoyl-CoA hydratase-related protein [Chitinophagales bacterium]
MLYTSDQLHEFKNQTFAHLLIEEKDHLLTLTLNRPEKKNALNPVLFNELAYALTYAAQNRDTWAVVIAAAGDVFCAGADLKAFAGATEETTSTVPQATKEVVIGDIFNALHKPCIAKVHAPVYAGGFLIVCGCTHVVASSNATFSLPEVKRGLFPFQVMQSLLQIMPPRAVLDFCMRAKTLNAADAEKVGLVSKVVEPATLNEEVQALVNEIFQYSPSAIRLGLEAFDNLKRTPADEAHKYLKQMLGECIQTEDAAEGLQAFAEKRKPVWKG